MTTPTLVACIGDSMTEGSSSANPYPEQLSQLLGPTYLVSNYGASGATVSMIEGNWRNLVYGSGYTSLCCLGGINDVVAGSTGATVLALLTALYDEIRGQGLALAPATLLPFHNYASWSAGRQTHLETVNTGIRAYCVSNSLTCADFYATMAAGGDATALATAYDSGDGFHPNEAGNAVMAAAFKAIISP